MDGMAIVWDIGIGGGGVARGPLLVFTDICDTKFDLVDEDVLKNPIKGYCGAEYPPLPDQDFSWRT